jgi:hypothetical protein
MRECANGRGGSSLVREGVSALVLAGFAYSYAEPGK